MHINFRKDQNQEVGIQIIVQMIRISNFKKFEVWKHCQKSGELKNCKKEKRRIPYSLEDFRPFWPEPFLDI